MLRDEIGGGRRALEKGEQWRREKGICYNRNDFKMGCKAHGSYTYALKGKTINDSEIE